LTYPTVFVSKGVRQHHASRIPDHSEEERMQRATIRHGAVPVLPASGAGERRLVGLGDLERRVILYLRLWETGEAGRREVWQDVAARLGAASGRAALRRFEALRAAIASHAPRPPMIRPLAAGEAGQDELLLAGLVAAAAAGDGKALVAHAREIAPLAADRIATIAAETAPGLAATPAPLAAVTCGGTPPARRM
jgi:hypothetical protein